MSKRCVEGMRQRRFMTGIANYHIYKAEICFLYGAYAEALEHVRAQDDLIASVMSLPQPVRFYIIAYFLTLAACLPGMDPDEQTETRKRMRANLKRMTRLAAHCPANFLHLQLFMQAELARLDRRIEPAMRLYEHAMEVARANEFRRNEAMINELAARHLIGAGRRKAAEGYLRAAWNLHEQWAPGARSSNWRGSFRSCSALQSPVPAEFQARPTCTQRLRWRSKPFCCRLKVCHCMMVSKKARSYRTIVRAVRFGSIAEMTTPIDYSTKCQKQTLGPQSR